MILTIDLETYSPQDIGKVGAYRYAQDLHNQPRQRGLARETLRAAVALRHGGAG